MVQMVAPSTKLSPSKCRIEACLVLGSNRTGQRFPPPITANCGNVGRLQPSEKVWNTANRLRGKLHARTSLGQGRKRKCPYRRVRPWTPWCRSPCLNEFRWPSKHSEQHPACPFDPLAPAMPPARKHPDAGLRTHHGRSGPVESGSTPTRLTTCVGPGRLRRADLGPVGPDH